MTENNNIRKILDDEKLMQFCTRIINYRKTLEGDMRYFFLVTLISSDTLFTIEDCEKSLEILNFIKTNISLITSDEKIKKETLKYLNKGLKIVKQDLKHFKEQQYGK